MKKNWDHFNKIPAKFWEIDSETTKGKKYIVKFTKQGFSCNCLDFLMREQIKGECKHILKVKKRSKIGQQS